MKAKVEKLKRDKEMRKPSIIYQLGKKFSIRVILLSQYLTEKYKKDKIIPILTNQLLRSGTSIGANISEGEEAVSNADFINKLSISLKEANETKYWLELLYEAHYLSDQEYQSIYNDCCQITGSLVNTINANKNKTK